MSLKPSVANPHHHANPLPTSYSARGEVKSGVDKEPNDEKKQSGSLITVLIAIAANLLIAIAKSIAAFITGSASMIAEAALSWADTGNGVFLLVAEKNPSSLQIVAIR